MNEEEIDLWYEEQKQLLSEQYVKSIENGMKIDDRENRFNKAMGRLDAKYHGKHDKLWHNMGAPFVAIGRGFAVFFIFLGAGIKNSFRAKCGQAHFKANICWIKNAYKVPVGLGNAFRPFYFFYVKHLQVPCHIIAKPFVLSGRAVKNMIRGIGRFFAKLAVVVRKYMKVAFKFTIKHSMAGYKAVSSWLGGIAKRYQEWSAKRIQAHLDRKQARKEAKEKKKKEQEERKKANEEAKAGGEQGKEGQEQQEGSSDAAQQGGEAKEEQAQGDAGAESKEEKAS
jgi:hypothetical protein